MMNKGCIVRSRAHWADMKFGSIVALRWDERIEEGFGASRFFYVAKDFGHESFQRVRSLKLEITFSVHVGIEIGDQLLVDLLAMLLRPLRRADQAELFRIPNGEHNCPL